MHTSITRPVAFLPALAVVAFALLGATGCDKGDSTTTPTPTTPTPTVTETFAGSLNVNGAVTFSFSTTAAGIVTASLRTVTPDSTIQLSLALGTWNGVNCQVVLTNDRASVGGSITGNVGGAGSLCVRIADVGQVTQPTGFEIVVVHP